MRHAATQKAALLRSFRPDIEGFRALAIIMVDVHHAGFMVFGGVDTSFALSGFLVTSHLLKEVANTGKVAFGAFYARRARRLLPAATLVIVTTLLAAWAWLPSFKLKAVGLDGLSAALSVINVRLAATSTDYFADSATTSPLQHFWSLSVEEQYYLVWPLLFVTVAWLGTKLMRRHVPVIGMTLVAVAGVSLYLSVTVTRTAQPWAYFGFHTRAWELAIGALVAVGANLFARMWQPLAAFVSWAGLIVIAVGSVMISHSREIPGSVMLWPVVGTALFIMGGCAAPRFGAELLLGWRPIRALGRMSYSWYLWHWPVLIIAPYVLGFQPNRYQNLALVGVSLGLAALTYHLVEAPIKRARSLVEQPRRGLAFGARFIMASVVTAEVLVVSASAYAMPVHLPATYADPQAIQKQVIAATHITQLAASADMAVSNAKQRLYGGCLADFREEQAKPCTLGEPGATKQMVLLGSSLAWQWIPALDAIARQRHLRLTVFAKGSCPAERYSVVVDIFDDTAGKIVQKGPYTQCDAWRQDAYKKIAALQPQVVVFASRHEASATPEAIEQSVGYFRKLSARVVVIGETPRFHFDVPECVLQHTNELQRCNMSLAEIFPDRSSDRMANSASEKGGATVIDPLKWLCTDICPPVVEGIVAYQDDHHLTAAIALWLTHVLAAALPPF